MFPAGKKPCDLRIHASSTGYTFVREHDTFLSEAGYNFNPFRSKSFTLQKNADNSLALGQHPLWNIIRKTSYPERD